MHFLGVSFILKKWVEQVTGEPVIRSVPLKGGISSKMTKFELENIKSVISRQITNQQWLKDEPDLIEHEEQALRVLESMSIPTPDFIASSTPNLHALLMTELPGNVRLDLEDFPLSFEQLASTLHEIHQTAIPITFNWTYASYIDVEKVKVPSWSNEQNSWSVAIDFVSSHSAHFDPVFIHRDYHPTNILWEGNKLSGVVDWINACRGPALVDVAHCRINLVMLYGLEVADQFLEAYLHYSQSPYTPYWDILGYFDFVDEHLDIYDGWTALGHSNLTQQIMRQRSDEYINDLTTKINSLKRHY